MGLGRRAALLPARRGQRARRLRAPRRRRAAARLGLAGAHRPLAGLPRCRGRPRPARQRGLQRPPAGRRRLVPADDARRPARQHRRLLPAPGHGPPEPAPSRPTCTCTASSSTAPAPSASPARGSASCSSSAPSARSSSRPAPTCRRRSCGCRASGAPTSSPLLQVPTVAEVPGVGLGLQDHPAFGRDLHLRGAGEPQGRADRGEPRAVGAGRRPAVVQRRRVRRLPAHARRAGGARRPVPHGLGDVRAGGPAAPAGARLHAVGLRGQAAEPRPGGRRLARPDDQAVHPAQLLRRARGHALGGGRAARGPRDRAHRAAGPVRPGRPQRARRPTATPTSRRTSATRARRSTTRRAPAGWASTTSR